MGPWSGRHYMLTNKTVIKGQKHQPFKRIVEIALVSIQTCEQAVIGTVQ